MQYWRSVSRAHQGICVLQGFMLDWHVVPSFLWGKRPGLASGSGRLTHRTYSSFFHTSYTQACSNNPVLPGLALTKTRCTISLFVWEWNLGLWGQANYCRELSMTTLRGLALYRPFLPLQWVWHYLSVNAMQLGLSSNWIKDFSSHWTSDGDSDNQQQRKLIWKLSQGNDFLFNSSSQRQRMLCDYLLLCCCRFSTWPEKNCYQPLQSFLAVAVCLLQNPEILINGFV